MKKRNAAKPKAKPKNPHAQAMVKRRNQKLTPARRSEIASAAASAMWAKKRLEAQ